MSGSHHDHHHDHHHPHHHDDDHAHDPDRWKHDGVRVIPGNQLDPNVPSTKGMDRKAAINFARVGAQKLWAGTVTIHANAKTGAHHHGHLESVIYVVKGKAPEELVAAVHDIHAGGSPMSSAIARMVVGSFQKETQQRILDEQLTEREKSLLDQLANGLLYKEIADKWDISIETVRKHARNIYAKLQVGTRTEAIRKVYPDR